MPQTIPKSHPADSHHTEHLARPVARKAAVRTDAEKPACLTRVLRMRRRRDDVDEIDRSETRGTRPQQKPAAVQVQKSSEAKPQAKPTRPPLTDQLRHCLAQYELLKKQVLCAELTQTAMPNQDTLERNAQKLLARITSLRNQLAIRHGQTGQQRTRQQRTRQQPVADSRSVAFDPANVASTELHNGSSQAAKASPPRRRRTIQLSVAEPTARILKAFVDAGKSPSAVVQRALWKDQNVLDAALLLGLKPPSQ